jgi:ketosteroid isomerase-like protein
LRREAALRRRCRRGDRPIAAINPAWFEAYNEGDVDRIAALYAEDAVFNAPGLQALRGREAIRAYLARLAFVPPATTEHGLSGDLGWELGTFALTDAAGATVDTGKYVTVYQRLGGKWLIIRDTLNLDTPPAAAVPAPASALAPAAGSEASPTAELGAISDLESGADPTGVSEAAAPAPEAPPAEWPAGESPIG